MLLAQLLHVAGVDCVILEQRDQVHVEGRIRAGVLEQATVDLLARVGVDHRLKVEGLAHEGFNLAHDGEVFRVDLKALTGGSHVTVYGQTEVTRDLIEACQSRALPLIFAASQVALHDVDSVAPFVTYVKDATSQRLDCDFIAGCDGYHGVSRQTIPPALRTEFERSYPFGWLGILADVPPCHHELIYSNHERGFALASMRSLTRSRYYVQCGLDEHVKDWPDERLWDELACRLGDDVAANMTRGPALEKSIAPLRSYVCEPARYGRLFLAGDAAHIVPPTGAKGLNLAASDVKFLADAMIDFYRRGQDDLLHGYSQKALARVWKAERFSWWFTALTHHFPGTDAFARKMQIAELAYIRTSIAAQTSLAENYVGLPFT